MKLTFHSSQRHSYLKVENRIDTMTSYDIHIGSSYKRSSYTTYSSNFPPRSNCMTPSENHGLNTKIYNIIVSDLSMRKALKEDDLDLTSQSPTYKF